MAAWVDVEAYVVRETGKETGVKTGAAVGWARVVDSDVAAARDSDRAAEAVSDWAAAIDSVAVK